jgi:hypothetical protein
MSRLSRLAAIALVGLPLCPIAADAAAPIASVTSTILSQSTYVYAAGDVVFQLSNPNNGVSGCYGFWLKATDSGFKNNLAALLALIQSQAPVTVWADNTQVWTGSTQQYCLVYALQI